MDSPMTASPPRAPLCDPSSSTASPDALAGAAILRQLKAQTATEATISELKQDARTIGEDRFAMGPGRKRSRAWEQLPENDPLHRREKKTRSAYVSRFRNEAYRSLLERRIEAGAVENAKTHERLQAVKDEQDRLRADMALLQKQVEAARKDTANAPPVATEAPAFNAPPPLALAPVPCLAPTRPCSPPREDERQIPDSPVSPVSTSMEASDQALTDALEIAPEDPFALLPAALTRIIFTDLSPIGTETFPFPE